MVVWIAFAVAVLAPIVTSLVCALAPRAFWYVIALGAALAAVEWALAYDANLVETGGDWNPGSELFLVTGLLASLYFSVWVFLALVGRAVGFWRRRRAA